MTEPVASPEKERGSLLNHLVENAIEKFKGKKYFDEENREPYNLISAAEDAVEQSGISPSELAVTLAKVTSLSPKEARVIAHSIGIKDDSWDGVFEGVSAIIVKAEIVKRYPELNYEDGERTEEWAKVLVQKKKTQS